MNPIIFQEALKATARIACCASFVSIVACQTKADDSAIDTSAVAEPEEQTNTGLDFDTCMGEIEEGFADPNFDTSVLVDCCLLTTEQLGYEALYTDPQYTQFSENCCGEIANQGEFSSACTPWGPPTPPSMCSKGGNYA